MFPAVYFAVPSMNESGNIERLILSIQRQSYKNNRTVVCVNHPEHYWQDHKYQSIVLNNMRTLQYLASLNDQRIEVIDFASAGRGLYGQQATVGWVRRFLFDYISSQANTDDIIISMDADCTFDEGFVQSIVLLCLTNRRAIAINNPYYHCLTGDERIDTAILRYETYIRWYMINLLRIGSPYAFTALGSVIAFPVWSYRKIGSFEPRAAGEDFYILQKLRKNGQILTYNTHLVFPASRYSDRVPYGTGPALMMPIEQQQEQYPFYSARCFDMLKTFYASFAVRYDNQLLDEFDAIIRDYFHEDPGELWYKLRKNNPKRERFIHACYCKFDALQAYRFIRYFHQQYNVSFDGIEEEYSYLLKETAQLFPYLSSRIRQLERIIHKHFSFVQQIFRDILFQLEMKLRRERDWFIIQSRNKNIWKYLS